MKHASHADVILRLKRAHGHLGSVLTMFADERPCVDLAQQLHAIENAVRNAKRELIHDHIEQCLGDESEHGDDHGLGGKAALKELKQLSKYL